MKGVLGINSFSWKPGWNNIKKEETSGIKIDDRWNVKEYGYLKNGSFSTFEWKPGWLENIRKKIPIKFCLRRPEDATEVYISTDSALFFTSHNRRVLHFVASYARAQGKNPVTFGPTDLVCCRILQGHTGKVYSLDWTPEKNRIVSASQDGRLIVWNALTSQKTHAITLPCAWVMTCAFSPTGQSVACGGLDSICSIFNLSSPPEKDNKTPVSRMLSGHKGYVSSCQYVPDDDTRLITGSGDQTCVLWNITTGLRASVFGGEFQSGHTSDVLSVSINASNSRTFVSGSCDATVRLWDTRVASRAVRTFYGHEGDVNSVKFFPDGNRFGTESEDGTRRLFDIRTGHQLQVYPPQQQQGDNDIPNPTVTSIAFSTSGRLLFASYSNGDCFIWDTILAEVVLNLGNTQFSQDETVKTSYSWQDKKGPRVCILDGGIHIPMLFELLTGEVVVLEIAPWISDLDDMEKRFLDLDF